MKRSPSEEAALRRFAIAVGDFIRHWGFRRIHGQIWAVLFLGRAAMSGADLTRVLKVSKALVSPALAELESYKLVRPRGGDGKTRRYVANPEVVAVIREVLKNREQRLIETAQKRMADLCEVSAQQTNSKLDPERMQLVGDMIQTAHHGLDFILQLSQGPDDEVWARLTESAV
ncbi:MAG: GbsR/MarR family transcriptional regulator [Bdellovibrionales bacterium]